MLAKYRLKSRKAFSYTYKKGKSVRDGYMTMIVAPTKGGIKVGFSVSKKVGKSVVRNTTKRRLREVFYRHIADIKVNNYIIVAKENISDLNFSDIETHVVKLLNKANCLDKASI